MKLLLVFIELGLDLVQDAQDVTVVRILKLKLVDYIQEVDDAIGSLPEHLVQLDN